MEQAAGTGTAAPSRAGARKPGDEQLPEARSRPRARQGRRPAAVLPRPVPAPGQAAARACHPRASRRPRRCSPPCPGSCPRRPSPHWRDGSSRREPGRRLRELRPCRLPQDLIPAAGVASRALHGPPFRARLHAVALSARRAAVIPARRPGARPGGQPGRAFASVIPVRRRLLPDSRPCLTGRLSCGGQETAFHCRGTRAGI